MTRRKFSTGVHSFLEAPNVPPVTVPIVSPRKMNLVGYAGTLGEYTASGSPYTTQDKFTVRLAATNLQLIYQGREALSATVQAVIQKNNDPLINVFFGGVASVSFSTSYNRLVSDVIAGLSVVPGDIIRVRTYRSGEGCSGRPTPGNGNDEGYIVGNYLTGAWPTVGVTPGAVASCQEIIGDVVSLTADSWVIAGDSIASMGFFDGAFIAKNKAFATYSRTGEQAACIADSNIIFARFGNTPEFTHLLCEYGVNDVGGAVDAGLTGIASAALLQANWISWWRRFTNTGIKVIQTTPTPSTTSTDNWTTVGNQTVRNAQAEVARLIVNGWLRDGAPMAYGQPLAAGSTDPLALRLGQAGHLLYGIIDVAASVEAPSNSSKWVPTYTTDGTHPEPVAEAPMNAAVTTWLNSKGL